jgi:thiol-disulfide isomerase/thioredoxin
MARWQYEGHALQAYLLLARIAGMKDQAAIETWQAGRSEEVIAQAAASNPAAKPVAAETAGIGIALRWDGELLVVGQVLPDSPAAASKNIAIGDRILDVATGNEPAVDVAGLKLEEAVQLIRGPKGSTIRMTIVPAGKDESHARAISLIRGEIKQLARWGDGMKLAGGTEAPDIAMVRLDDNQSEQLHAFMGKTVVIDFWAIWCKPCLRQLAEMQNFRERYPDWKDRVVIIAASVDEDRQAPNKLLNERGWHATRNVIVGEEAIKAYHVNSLPTTYVIDPQGKIVARDDDETIWQTVERLLKE